MRPLRPAPEAALTQIRAFFVPQLVNDPENWPVYVYCHGGRHRTGVMTAIYRMAVEGCDVQRAYAEMRRYGFYKRWGHGPLKAYVFDYYRQLHQGRINQIIVSREISVTSVPADLSP